MHQPLVDLSLLDALQVQTLDDHATSAKDKQFLLAAQDPAHIAAQALSGLDVHFISSGKWALHDLLVCLLQYCSPAVLYISTFSVTEFPARILASNISSGAVSALHLLLDYRAKKRYPAVVQLAANIATTIRTIPVHAKVFVLESAEISFTVIGSANWTVNPRVESGLITSCRDAAAFHKNWISKAIHDGNPFQL